MEGGGEGKEQMLLPPGFRFHPTDEELITYYLINKITDSNFTERAVADVDLNKCEPWDLPGKAKMGEKEWYFFSLRDRKYPTGVRTNRATNSGYWKTTGKDREIYTTTSNTTEVEVVVVGMKKTLVFYRGRAPRGEKTNWVMHEYRIHPKSSYRTSTAAKDEWVVCRVIQKSGGVKRYSSTHSHSHSHSRAVVNPYNLEITPSGSMIINSQIMMMQQQQQQQPDAYHQFPVGGRNYISQAELEQLTRINYRAASTNGLPFPSAQSQLNYAHVSGGAATSAAFTMSGLNLNLGGAPMTKPPIPLSAGGINQHDHPTSSMLPNGYASTTTDQMNNIANAMGGRYVLGMDDQCAADSDNYWPTY